MKENIRKILIAGAGGYIGTVMTDYLLKKGYSIIALDRFFFGEDVLKYCKHQENLKIVREDTRFFEETLLKGVDAVIDLSGLSNDPSAALDPSLTKNINVDGCIRLATIAKKMHVKRYIYASSCSVYGEGETLRLSEKSKLNPLTVYAKSKVIVEKKLQKLLSDSFCVTIARNATCYGLSARMRFDLSINTMTLSAYKDNVINVNAGGKQWRPFVHIFDVARAYERILEMPKSVVNNQIFNIGSDEQNYQLITIAKIIKKEFPKAKIKILSKSVEQRNYNVSFEKTRKLLGFTPMKSIKDGVLEVKNALEEGKITSNIMTMTVDYYKYLIDANTVLEKIKYKNLLF